MLLHPTPLGTLYTIGYAHPDEAARVAELMRHARILLFDIRYIPRSRWYPAWTRSALMDAYGDRYVWEPRLGNRNYQTRASGIMLADGNEKAIEAAAHLLAQGISLILLCACKDASTCHRSLVAKLIQDAFATRHEEVQG